MISLLLMVLRISSCAFGSPIRRRALAGLTSALMLVALPGFPMPSSHARVESIPAAAGPWLDRLNLWRMTAGLQTLTDNATWSDGDYKHSLYMVRNDLVTHYETPGVPYYTAEGDTAARNSNIQVNSTTNFSDEQAIDWWMAAPFHALGMMDPRLKSTGFGAYRQVKSGWQAGFSVDTLRGNSFTGGAYPVYWPGNGVTAPLTKYSGNEFPDPLQACPGYSVPTGLPVFIQVGGNVTTTAGPVHTFTGNGTALAHCVIDSNNAAVGSSLKSRGAVIVIPRQPLQTGVTYVVTLTVNNLPYTWSFTVGPLVIEPPGWDSLGGVLTSSPEASSNVATPTVENVFVKGVGDGLWTVPVTAGVAGTWTSLGGTFLSDPGAAQSSTDTMVFVRGVSNTIWYRTKTGSSWGPWVKFNGVILDGPEPVFGAVAGRMDLFVEGADKALWWNAGISASGWTRLGGVLSSRVGAVSSGLGHEDIFVRGMDRAIWGRFGNGTTFGSWFKLGGSSLSAPGVSSCATGKVDVWVIGVDRALWSIGYDGTSWGSWKRWGGMFTLGVNAICQPGTTNVDVYARGPDAALWHATLTGT